VISLLDPKRRRPSGRSPDGSGPADPRVHAETRDYYERNAPAYAQATLRLSMAPQLSRFASALPRGAAVLDLGCGSGRDLVALSSAGFQAIGLDISPALAALAREHSGCPVTVGDLCDPPYEDGRFDGIWAAACLLHLQRSEIPPTLARLRRLLRPCGRFFASMKVGTGEARSEDGRWFTYVSAQEWRERLEQAGFDDIDLVEDWENSPDGESGRERWLQSFAATTP